MAEPYFKASAMTKSQITSYRFGSKFTITNNYRYDII